MSAGDWAVEVVITFAVAGFAAAAAAGARALFWAVDDFDAGGKVVVVNAAAGVWLGGNVTCWANRVNVAGWEVDCDGALC